MHQKQGAKRFPRSAMLRRLDEIAAVFGEYREYFREVAHDIQDSPALQDLALSRSEICDELYHEIDGVMRSLAYWR